MTVHKTKEGYSFDGSNNYISTPDNTRQRGDTNFTIAYWVNAPSSSSDRTILNKYDPRQDNRVWIHRLFSDDTFSVGIYDEGDNSQGFGTDSAEFAPSTWQHITITVDTRTPDATFYVNGSSVQSSLSYGSGYTSPMGDDAEEVQIGRRFSNTGTTDYFEGTLDDVRFYDKVLSASEVSNLYNSGSI